MPLQPATGDGGGDGGAGEWRGRVEVGRPGASRFKLVEWDPRTQAVVLWEQGPDRRLHLTPLGQASFEPQDPALRL